MPVAVYGAVFEYLAFAGAGAALSAAGATVAYGITYAAVVYGVSYAAQQLANKPRAASSTPQGIKFNVRSSIEPQRIIYGERIVGGPFAFIGESNLNDQAIDYFYSTIPSTAPYTITLPNASVYASTLAVQEVSLIDPADPFWTGYTVTGGAPAQGQYQVSAGVYTFNSADAGKYMAITYVWDQPGVQAVNQYLHLVITLAGHEVDSIPNVYFGADEVGTLDGNGDVTTGKFAGKMRVKKYLGTTTQTADADLISALPTFWTSEHRGRGIAYIYVRLSFAPDTYTSGLLPITAKVRGKKCYNPQSTLTEWTQNPAIIIRDYCTSVYGFNATSADIDDATVITALGICNQNVDKPGGGQHTRYVCDYTFTLDKAPPDVLRDLLLTMVGWWAYSKGLIRIFAGDFVTPDAVALTTADLRGPVSLQARTPRRNLFNSVRGLYFASEKNFEYTDYPSITNSTYVANDGGQKLYLDVNFDGVTDGIRCQRLAKILLEKARDSLRVQWPGNMRCYRRDVCDVVPVTLSQLGWSAKNFRVVDRKYIPGTGVDLVLEEEDSTNYTWSASDGVTIDASPDTNLQNPFFVPPVLGLALTSNPSDDVIGADGTIICRVKVSWTKSTNVYVLANGGRVQIVYKKSSATKWGYAIEVAGDLDQHYIEGIVVNETYLVMVRFKNSIGRFGPWTAPIAVANSSLTRGPSINNRIQNERGQQGFIKVPEDAYFQARGRYSYPPPHYTLLTNPSFDGSDSNASPLLTAIPSSLNAFGAGSPGFQITLPNSLNTTSTPLQIVYVGQTTGLAIHIASESRTAIPIARNRRYQFSLDVAVTSGATIDGGVYIYDSSSSAFFDVRSYTSVATVIVNSMFTLNGASTHAHGGTSAASNWVNMNMIFELSSGFNITSGQFFSSLPYIFPRKVGSTGGTVYALANNWMYGETLANQTVPAPFSGFGGFDTGQYFNTQPGMATAFYTAAIGITTCVQIQSAWVVNDGVGNYTKVAELNVTATTTCDLVCTVVANTFAVQTAAGVLAQLFLWSGTLTTSGNINPTSLGRGATMTTAADSSSWRPNLSFEYRDGPIAAGGVRSYQVLGRSSVANSVATIAFRTFDGLFKIEEVRR